MDSKQEVKQENSIEITLTEQLKKLIYDKMSRYPVSRKYLQQFLDLRKKAEDNHLDLLIQQIEQYSLDIVTVVHAELFNKCNDMNRCNEVIGLCEEVIHPYDEKPEFQQISSDIKKLKNQVGQALALKLVQNLTDQVIKNSKKESPQDVKIQVLLNSYCQEKNISIEQSKKLTKLDPGFLSWFLMQYDAVVKDEQKRKFCLVIAETLYQEMKSLIHNESLPVRLGSLVNDFEERINRDKVVSQEKPKRNTQDKVTSTQRQLVTVNPGNNKNTTFSKLENKDELEEDGSMIFTRDYSTGFMGE